MAIDLPELSPEILAKYQLANNALISRNKEFSMEIGDSKQADFLPQIKLCRWDNECNFSARLVVDPAIFAVPVCTIGAEKLAYVLGQVLIARFYDKNPETFAFDIILPQKPKANTIQWTIQHKGLDFFYQDSLINDFNAGRLPNNIVNATETQAWNIDDYCVRTRPANVVGSYAVYHSTKAGDYSRLGGQNYRAGKAFHIYRPKIIDAANKEIWGDLRIDAEAGIMSIIIPQDFLDNAIYPVCVDPDLGYITAGGSGDGDNYIKYASHATTDASGGNTSEIHVYCRAGSGGGAHFHCGVYNDNAGNNRPNALLLTQIEITPPGNAQWTAGVYVTALSASTKYWPAVGSSVYGIEKAYDSSAANKTAYSTGSGDGVLPSPWSHTGNTANIFSIHAVYAGNGGPPFPPLFRAHRSIFVEV